MKAETQAVLNTAKAQYGFLNEDQVKTLATDPETRLTLVLVRCGAGRFLAPAQDAQHFIDIIEQHAKIHAAGGVKVAEAGICTHDYIRDVSLPSEFKIAGDPPRKTPAPVRETLRQATERVIRDFDGRDYSGAFDGNTVTSDADPGL